MIGFQPGKSNKSFFFLLFFVVSDHLINFIFFLPIKILMVFVAFFHEVDFWLSSIDGIINFFPLIPIILDLDFLETGFGHDHCIKFASDEVIVWLFVVVDWANVPEQVSHLKTEICRQVWWTDAFFHLGYFFVFLFFCFCLDFAPWQFGFEHVDDQVEKWLDIVPPAVMDVIVDVDAHEGHFFEIGVALLVRNVAAGLFVPEPHTMAKINHVNEWTLRAEPDAEITESQVSVDISQLMYFFDAIEDLQSNKQASGRTEPVITKFMQFSYVGP